MRIDRAVTRMSSGQVAKRPIVDRQTPVKTLSSLVVGKMLPPPQIFSYEQYYFSQRGINFEQIAQTVKGVGSRRGLFKEHSCFSSQFTIEANKCTENT